MNDALRGLGTFPLSEPYTALGYEHVGSGGESILTEVLATEGSDAVVDWVVLELRDPFGAGTILASRSALVQRDGDVVDVDGRSPVPFTVPSGSYYVAVRHRNHLGVMTADPITLGRAYYAVDFTTGTTTACGTNSTKSIGGVELLWAGDVSFDVILKYTGDGNDRDKILEAIGGSLPTNTVNGYLPEDVDLDATVKYTGNGNDRDRILANIG